MGNTKECFQTIHVVTVEPYGERQTKRRKKLHEDGSADSSKYGNRLHIIGYNEDDTTVV